MKNALCLMVVLCSLHAAGADRLGVYQHGTVIRMRMGDCMASPKGFMVTMGGTSTVIAGDACPEYTLVSDKVVFVIVGRSSNQLIPLADVIDFRFHNRELAVRLDDAKRESKFGIKEMMLRSEWDLIQKHITEQLNSTPAQANDVLVTRNRN